MRNILASSPQFSRGSGMSAGDAFAESALSPDQLAVVWNDAGEVVTASPTARPNSREYEVDVMRYPADLNLAAAIDLRRGVQGKIPLLSEDTLFLTTVPEFSERTRILTLDGEKLAMSDLELSQWLIKAEREVSIGTDNHPLFETSLEETACTIRRLPNGQVAMTEVPRQHVLAARERVARLIGDRPNSRINVRVETPLRSAARYFLTALPEGDASFHAGREAEVTAFLLIGKAGFSLGLWSPKTEIFSEYAFLAPTEIYQQPKTRGKKRMSEEPAAPADGADDTQKMDAYIRHAIDQLLLQLSTEKLENLQLSGYGRAVWVSERELAESIAPITKEYSEKHGLDFFRIDAPVDEAVAGGLLLGSFGFGEAMPMGAVNLPPVDLARDILVRADTEEIGRRQQEEMRLQERRDRALFTLLAAPVAVAAILLGLAFALVIGRGITVIRESRADAKTQELKPALDRRNSYEANLKWYQEFITQVSRLRRQQPVGIGLLYQLNSNYPFAIDPTFYISDMKLTPAGEVEMKGFARNKDAIAAFLKTLEFAGGPESGSRLFSNLAYEVQESVPTAQVPAGQSAMPTMAGSALVAKAAAPGVISWSMKGNFVPMAEFAPPDPKAKPVPTPAAAAPAPTPAA